MKLNLPAVLFILVGVLLIYSAKKDMDPRNVIFESLGIARRVPNPDPIGAGQSVGKWMEPSSTPSPNKPGTPVVTV